MRVSFDVKKEHIEKGKCGDMNCCAVALALLDLGYKRTSVGKYIITVYDKDNQRFLCESIPWELREYIKAFDKRKLYITPHTFIIELLHWM